MSSRIGAVGLVALGMLAGAGWVLAVGPRIAAAESASGSWQVVADVHSYPQPGAWRLNTVTGDLRYCTNINSGWQCIRVSYE